MPFFVVAFGTLLPCLTLRSAEVLISWVLGPLYSQRKIFFITIRLIWLHLSYMMIYIASEKIGWRNILNIAHVYFYFSLFTLRCSSWVQFSVLKFENSCFSLQIYLKIQNKNHLRIGQKLDDIFEKPFCHLFWTTRYNQCRGRVSEEALPPLPHTSPRRASQPY